MNKKINKVYIIGSGIVGCTIARELADTNVYVEIFEKRNHIGGNLFDCIDEHGIRIHKYGPHIFHTDNENIWKYVNRFSDFTPYTLVCGAVINGKCVPTAFDFTSIDTFFPSEAEEIKGHIKEYYGSRESATVLELLECKDELIRRFAQFLYDNDYSLYTAKQWGISPSDVDRQIFSRVPIVFSYRNQYFSDKYQAMPQNGYSQLINNLLEHPNIKINIGVNALELFEFDNDKIIYKDRPKENDNLVVYTGPIDELFKCAYGHLPYRSLKFNWKYEEKSSFQQMAVVAYPQEKGFTRITEYKKLPYQNTMGTTYAIEYPIPYKEGGQNEPYYPVLTEKSKRTYTLYSEKAAEFRNLICCGRLADFKYYDMDKAIERALEVSNMIKNR